MTDESWYVVRNIRGVTGFVGSGAKPTPLTDAEAARFGVEVKTRAVVGSFDVGDVVKRSPLALWRGLAALWRLWIWRLSVSR